MDTKNFSNLLIKVAGIIIVIVTIINIPYYILYYKSLSLSLFMGKVIVPISLPLLIGIFMFNRPEVLTNKVVIEDGKTINKIESETYLKLEQIALSVLGFYFLFQSVSELVFHATCFFQAKASISSQGKSPSNSLIFTPNFIATIAEFILASWLILKVEGIVVFINKIRTERN